MGRPKILDRGMLRDHGGRCMGLNDAPMASSIFIVVVYILE